MYLGARKSQDIQTRGVSILGSSWDVYYMWVLGNPGIFRQGGGLNPGMNLGTRESQDTQTRGGSISWDLPGMYILGTLVQYYVTWDSIILYERVLAFLDMSGRNAYIFIARGV